MKTVKSRNVKISFKLKDQERQTIRKLLSKGTESVRVIKRAQVLNLFDQGYTSPQISKAVSMDAVTVRTIGWRYIKSGMDNLRSHSAKSLIDFYGEEEGTRVRNKFQVHYTPKHASWLDQAEIEIGIYSRQCLGKSRIGSIDNLKKN